MAGACLGFARVRPWMHAPFATAGTVGRTPPSPRLVSIGRRGLTRDGVSWGSHGFVLFTVMGWAMLFSYRFTDVCSSPPRLVPHRLLSKFLPLLKAEKRWLPRTHCDTCTLRSISTLLGLFCRAGYAGLLCIVRALMGSRAGLSLC